MTPFEIARLESRFGTYRVAGNYDLSTRALQIDFTSAAKLGTDGWVEINVNAKAGIAELQKLMPELLQQLEV
ncbi:hypothetical protein [Ferrimonas senticii]|uniref:hypothetical protein n=1 Tax=Ferrimonas senticii TaxID=394566 RepID=UPI0003F7C4F2|nr:hypothetical protein [Ferrimonas senticii]